MGNVAGGGEVAKLKSKAVLRDGFATFVGCGTAREWGLCIHDVRVDSESFAGRCDQRRTNWTGGFDVSS